MGESGFFFGDWLALGPLDQHTAIEGRPAPRVALDIGMVTGVAVCVWDGA